MKYLRSTVFIPMYQQQYNTRLISKV